MAEEEPWYRTFNDVFFLTLAGSVFAFLGVALRACLKSRCSKIKCCSADGLIACDREPVADEFLNLDDPPKRPSEEETFKDVEVGAMPTSTPLSK